ncbi:MAG TPA: hypothetical protein PJ982_09350, partial [Lacipirellulaceae bacterium]|nr:hypothetical protein [Lacipirellulaceae bacterium]
MFKLAVGVAIAGGAATGAYLYLRMDNEIRQHVATYLAERYPDLRVSVGGARLVEGRGIAVYDIALSDPALEPGAAPLLAVD